MPVIRPQPKSVAVFGILIGILLLGGYLRINAVHDSEFQRVADGWGSVLSGDAHIYFTYAGNLRKHGVYSHYNLEVNGEFFHSQRMPPWNSAAAPRPDNFLPPGYPFFLTSLLADLPEQVDDPGVRAYLQRIGYAQAVLSTITILLAFLVAGQLLGTALALLPTAIVAIAPHLIVANLYVLTETLFCLVLTLVLLAILRSRGRSPVYGIFVGALIAAASLIKPAFLYFIVPLCLVYAFSKRDIGRGAVAGFLLFGFALVYSPWVIRNYATPGLSSDENLMATTLLAGAYPNLIYGDDPRTYPYPFTHDPDYERNSRTTSSSLREIQRRFLERPAEFLKWYLVGKPVLLWKWDITHGLGGGPFVYPLSVSPYGQSRLYQFTYQLSRTIQWPLVVLGLFGSVMAWLPACQRLFPAGAVFGFRVVSAILFYFTFVHAVTFADARYAVPLRPVLYMIAVLPLLYLRALVKSYRSAAGRG